MRPKPLSDKDNKQGADKRGSWPIAYQWVAMGTLVVYSAVGARTVTYAAEAPAAAQAPAAQTTGQTAYRFNIPAGTLDEVIRAYESVTGIRVTVTNEGIRAIASPGIAGSYTADQAMRRLLQNTGIVHRLSDAGSVTLSLPSVASTVEVSAETSALEVSSPKYSGPLLDTPQTVSVVPREIMEQQATTTLRDAVRNVAGISIAAGEGGAQGDSLTIRGFTARNDLYIDGMRDFGSYYRDPFNTQELDVLQGPSSVTFGRGSTGGVVNQATKSPRLNKFVAGDFDFGTDRTLRGTMDLSLPLRRLGKGAAFRINLMGNQNYVAGRDVAENRRYGVAPSLALGLTTRTRATFGYFHQFADDIPDYGIPWLFDGPAPVDRHNYYGFKNGNYLKTVADIGTAKVEHDFDVRFSLRNQFRYAEYGRDVLITEPRVPATVTPSTPLSAISITRNQLGSKSTETFLDDQVDFVARFKTGAIEHTLITGVEGGRETSSPTRPTYSNVPATSLLFPNPDQPFSGSFVISTSVKAESVSVSVYGLDTMNIGKKLEIIAGIRWDHFDTDYAQRIAPVAAFNRVDAMATWRAALVYKPVQPASIYLSSGTSFNPSAESLALSAGSASLPPEENRSYEGGVKWDPPNGRLSLRTALFRTDKNNARETDPANSLLVVLAGKQRVDGALIEVHGRLNTRWDVLSSYAWLDSKVLTSRFFPASIGAQLANVPRHTFNFWSNYSFSSRWVAAVGGNFVDSRTASTTVPFDPITGRLKQLPGYWVFSAMASHRLNEHVTLQANVYNIANRYYYDQLHPAHIVLGAGRSALIGFKYRF